MKERELRNRFPGHVTSDVLVIYCHITNSPQTPTNQRAFPISQLVRTRGQIGHTVWFCGPPPPAPRSRRNRGPAQTAVPFIGLRVLWPEGAALVRGGCVLPRAPPNTAQPSRLSKGGPRGLPGAERCSGDAAAPNRGPGGRQRELGTPRSPRAGRWGDRRNRVPRPNPSLALPPQRTSGFVRSCAAPGGAEASCPHHQLTPDTGP